MNKVSFSIIGRNEEKVIRGCLESIKPFAYEIIFVDTGSTDKTIDIVKEYTDKIYHFEWIDDFAAARNYALSFCTGDWVFSIDCDERLKGDITKLFDFGMDVWSFNQYQYKRVNCITNRMWRNGLGIQWKGKIHEGISLNPDLKVGRCNIIIEHDKSVINTWRNKKQYYLDLINDQDDELKKKYYNALYEIDNGNANKAIELFNEIINSTNTGIKAYLLSVIANIYYEIYKLYESSFIDLITKSIELTPNQVTGYLSLLNYYNSHNDKQMVIECLNRIKQNNTSKTTSMQNDIMLEDEEIEKLYTVFIN